HLARNGLVAHEIRRHEHRVRAQPLGAHRGHGRAHAVAARLVGGRAHHRAQAAPGHHHGAAAQGGIVALLHRGVERIHVDVDDLAHGSDGYVETFSLARGDGEADDRVMAVTKTLAVVGASEETTAHLRLLMKLGAKQLVHTWRWGSED